ncbi:MAG: hypothetical protein ACM31O_21025 [Bacteroidota bacterium]
MFDSNLPKSGRQFTFRNIVRGLGGDPRGDNAKELWSLIGGLDPDSLSAVRTSFAQQISQIGPGKVTEALRGVLRGQIDPLDLFQAATATAPPQDRAALYAEYGPPMGLGGESQSPHVPSAAELTTEMAQQASEAKTPLDQRQVHPAIARMYGLDPNRPWTNADVVRLGYDGPMSATGQEKWIKEHSSVVDDSTKIIESFIVMEYAMRGRPETLRLQTPSLPPHIGRLDLPTGSEILTGLLNTMEQFGMIDSNAAQAESEKRRAAGHVTSRLQAFSDALPPDIANEISNREKFMGKRIARKLTDDIKGTILEQLPRTDEETASTAQRIKENARLTAIIESNAAELVYRMGRMAGQSGHAFSDKDRDVFTQQFANSSNPESRLAAMQVSANKMFSTMEPAVLNAVARQVLIKNNPEITQAFLDSPVVPAKLKEAIRTGQAQQPATPAVAPVNQQGFSTGGRMEDPAPRQREAAATPEPVSPAPNAAELARQAALEAQRQQQTMVLGRYNMEIRRLQLAEQTARENRDYRACQEARQARLDAERERDKLAVVFAQIGRSVASNAARGGSVGGGISMGEGQDASAFRIVPRSQRQAPTPVPAVSGYGYVRQSRPRR